MIKVLQIFSSICEKGHGAAIYFTSIHASNQTTCCTLYARPACGPRFLQQRIRSSNVETADRSRGRCLGERRKSGRPVSSRHALFLINGLLNFLWSSGLFFKMKRPDWALYELLLFWLSILVLIVALSQISSFAAWLLTPYLAVTFAGWLNWRVVQLNKPFASAVARRASRGVGKDGRVSL